MERKGTRISSSGKTCIEKKEEKKHKDMRGKEKEELTSRAGVPGREHSISN